MKTKELKLTKEQTDLFSGISAEETQYKSAVLVIESHGHRIITTAEEAKEAAVEAGYKVIDPIVANENVKSIPDLRNYFYHRLWNKYPGRTAYHMEGNLPMELRQFRLFVESREANGLNRFNAIQECVALIDIIFDETDEFKFKEPIDIRVIGTGRCGWIVQKASLILSKKIQAKSEETLEKLIEEYENTDKIDLNKKAREIEQMLEGING